MNVQHTEHEIALTVNTGTRAVTVTRYDEDDATFLTIRDLNGPPDQEHGSARLTDTQAEWIARALLGIEDRHGPDEHTAREFTLSDLADLRARWANETQPYDTGGFLVSPRYNGQAKPRPPYIEQFAPKDDRHVTTGGKAPDWTSAHQTILRLSRERDDALARATRAEAAEASLRDAYSALTAATDPVYAVTEDDVDYEEVTMHVNATARETTREYRTSRRTVGPGETPERLRESIRYHLRSVAELEAIARVMEQG